MNILAKMMTALRGGATEVGEMVVDSQALRILDQEVRDASEELKQSKQSLASMLATQKLAEEKSEKIKKLIEENEGYALKALDKGDEGLAREVAGKIADFENELTSETATAKEYAEHAAGLRAAIKQAEDNIKRLKQQVDTVKATENVQRAQAAVAERHGGSNAKLQTAMESLERIKEKQAFKSAEMNAAAEIASELTDTSLQQKLEDAGIASSSTKADDVLARIKNKKQ